MRWFQFGAFCPLFRLHGYRTPTDGPSQCGGSGGRNEVHIHPHCLICLMLWLIVGVGIWRYCIRHHSWYHASARAVATLCHETCTSQPPPQTTHIHTYTYTHIHTHSTPPNHTYTHIHIHTHTNTHTHTHTHTHTTTQHNTTHQTHF